MIRKFKTSDKDVRCALWIAYDKKDVYTGELLKYREMEIDHIVPKNVFKDENKKLKIFEKLGLEKDFEKDSLENYVPTRREPNSSKKDNIDDIMIKRTLNKASIMKDKVEKLIEEYNKESDFMTATTKVALLADNEEKRQEAADIIFDEEDEFEDQESFIGETFKKSIRKVQLCAELPTVKNSIPSCMFRFRPLKLRECNVIVEHEEIFKKLFLSNYEYDNFEERPFINYQLDNGNYIVNLGGCSFALSESETRELCEIIDRYKELYFQKLGRLDTLYSLGGMVINQFSEIKLCTLNRNFCRIIFDFILNGKKSKEWNIFEPNLMMIKVYTDEENKKYNQGYHAIIYVRENYNYNMWQRENDVELCLTTSYITNNLKASEKDWWSPITVRKWLFDEFFPECLRNYYRKNRIRKMKNINYKEECKKYYSFQGDTRIKVKDMNNLEGISVHLNELQTFYAIYPERQVRFMNGSKKLYESFMILFNGCNKELYMPFLIGNLKMCERNVRTIEEFIIRKQEENPRKLRYSQIEVLLRCCIECMKNGQVSLSQQENAEFWEGMTELIDEYNYNIIREKFI